MKKLAVALLWITPLLILVQSCWPVENCRDVQPARVRSGTYLSSGEAEATGLRDADGTITLRIEREDSVLSISYVNPDGASVVERWTMLNPRID